METNLKHTETHFGLHHIDWKNCGGFRQLACDVEYWLDRLLTKQEEADLYSLYLYYVEKY